MNHVGRVPGRAASPGRWKAAARHLAGAAAALLAGGTMGPGPAAAEAAAQGAVVERTEKHTVRVNVLARGLEHPWSLAFLPDGRMLVTERPGRLRYVAADGTPDPTPIAGLPEAMAATGQGGLHDVALHPRVLAATASFTSPMPARAQAATAPSWPGAASTATALPRRGDPVQRALPKSCGEAVTSAGAWCSMATGRSSSPSGDRGDRTARAGPRRPRRLHHSPHRGTAAYQADNPYRSRWPARDPRSTPLATATCRERR